MATATAPAPYGAGEWDADKMEGIVFAVVEYFYMEICVKQIWQNIKIQHNDILLGEDAFLLFFPRHSAFKKQSLLQT